MVANLRNAATAKAPSFGLTRNAALLALSLLATTQPVSRSARSFSADEAIRRASRAWPSRSRCQGCWAAKAGRAAAGRSYGRFSMTGLRALRFVHVPARRTDMFRGIWATWATGPSSILSLYTFAIISTTCRPGNRRSASFMVFCIAYYRRQRSLKSLPGIRRTMSKRRAYQRARCERSPRRRLASCCKRHTATVSKPPSFCR